MAKTNKNTKTISKKPSRKTAPTSKKSSKKTIIAKTKAVAKKTEVRVQLAKNGKWSVIRSGNKNPSKNTTTQREAITVASAMAKRIGAEMVIYNKAGVVRKRYYK